MGTMVKKQIADPAAMMAEFPSDRPLVNAEAEEANPSPLVLHIETGTESVELALTERDTLKMWIGPSDS